MSKREVFVWDTEALKKKDEGEDWGEYRKRAGISVAAAMLLPSRRVRFFAQMEGKEGLNTLYALRDALLEAEVVVSYNGDYDKSVLSHALGGEPIGVREEFDLLKAIWRAVGTPFQKGWKLGQVGERTLGIGKSIEDGVLAPTLFQMGKIATLYEYCLQDVILTARLYDHIHDEGWVVKPNGEKLHLVMAPTGERKAALSAPSA